MTQEKIKRIHLIYSIVMSVLIAVVGICFIVSCILIYHSGDRPFTRESVAAYFANIAIPVYICIAAVVGGFLLEQILPVEPKRLKGEVSQSTVLARLCRRLDLSACGYDLRNEIERQRRIRVIIKTVCTVLCVACAIPVMIYLLTPGNFTVEALNHDAFSAMLFSVCFFLDGVTICFACSILERISLQREIELVKFAMANGAMKNPENEDASDWSRWGKPLVQALSTVIAILATVVFAVSVLSINGLVTAEDVVTVTSICIIGFLLFVGALVLYFYFFSHRTDIDWNKWLLWGVRAVIAVIAVVFIIVGIVNGGMADVLYKAIRICTECIGLG